MSWAHGIADRARDLGQRRRDLRTMLDGVADIQWWHPAWWGLVHGIALFEGFGPEMALDELYPLFLAADGGPRIDTFMARRCASAEPSGPSASVTAARIALAVVRARAAVDAIDTVDGTLPQQPLRCTMRWQHGWLRRTPLAHSHRVAFLTPRGAWLADLTPGAELDVGAQLAACLTGQAALPRIEPGAAAGTLAAVAVSLCDAPLDRARHVHRSAWTRGGGPWLGVATAGAYEVVTTCHLALDGYGHGCVASALFSRLDALAPLRADIESHIAARSVAQAAWTGDGVVAAGPAAGVATMVVERPVAFDEAAYAYGRTMAHIYLSERERRAARYSPTFEVPVAPRLSGADGDRRRHRVVHGLMALTMRDGEFEPYEAFQARLPAFIEREKDGAGVLTRLMQAALRVPVPAAWRRRYLGSPAQASRLVPPAEVLAGRGVLSTIRFPGGLASPAPIFAVSASPLAASPRDARGSNVLTLIHQAGFVTASVSGNGVAATHAGAGAILDVFRKELERRR